MSGEISIRIYIKVCNDDQVFVFVWAQQQPQQEKPTSQQEQQPQQPEMEEKKVSRCVARCGEPSSIDPSRSLQAEGIGDSLGMVGINT